MKWTLISIGISLVCGLIYLGYIYLEAKLEVKTAPREPMFECEKHGLFREKHLVTFLDNKWCPRCIDEKVQVPLDSTVDINWKIQ